VNPQTRSICSSSSREDRRFPWPWFNEFSLETSMLRRWRASLLACRTHHRGDLLVTNAWCAREADIVVVPSLYLHGTGFRAVNPWDNMETFLPVLDRQKKHRAFWEKVKSRYARETSRPGAGAPSVSSAVNATTTTTWPLIVVHYSYVFDASWNLGMLRALLEQPLAFQQRVVIGAIESNLHEEEARSLPPGWSPNGLAHPSSHRGPRIVSLPYPTSIMSLGAHPPNDALPNSSRPIAALFVGSLSRGRQTNTGRKGHPNQLRGAVVAMMRRAGAICREDECCGICVHGQEQACEEIILHHHHDRLWELPSRSIFCLEPPGDTLTRSHFYVAVTTGCVPVLFDGGDGSDLYSSDRPTYWPWRRVDPTTPAVVNNATLFDAALGQIGVDYATFAVILNTTNVLSTSTEFLEGLMTMPAENPARLLNLQSALRDFAPLVLYATSSTRATPVANDAFSQFFKLVTAPGVISHPHKRRHHRPHYRHEHRSAERGAQRSAAQRMEQQRIVESLQM
jgi:hypothetical protein